MERVERGGDDGGDGDGDGRRRPQRWGGGGLTMVEARAGGHWRQSACPRILPHSSDADFPPTITLLPMSETVSENGVGIPTIGVWV